MRGTSFSSSDVTARVASAKQGLYSSPSLSAHFLGIPHHPSSQPASQPASQKVSEWQTDHLLRYTILPACLPACALRAVPSIGVFVHIFSNIKETIMIPSSIGGRSVAHRKNSTKCAVVQCISCSEPDREKIIMDELLAVILNVVQ